MMQKGIDFDLLREIAENTSFTNYHEIDEESTNSSIKYRWKLWDVKPKKSNGRHFEELRLPTSIPKFEEDCQAISESNSSTISHQPSVGRGRSIALCSTSYSFSSPGAMNNSNANKVTKVKVMKSSAPSPWLIDSFSNLVDDYYGSDSITNDKISHRSCDFILKDSEFPSLGPMNGVKKLVEERVEANSERDKVNENIKTSFESEFNELKVAKCISKMHKLKDEISHQICDITLKDSEFPSLGPMNSVKPLVEERTEANSKRDNVNENIKTSFQPEFNEQDVAKCISKIHRLKDEISHYESDERAEKQSATCNLYNSAEKFNKTARECELADWPPAKVNKTARECEFVDGPPEKVNKTARKCEFADGHPEKVTVFNILKKPDQELSVSPVIRLKINGKYENFHVCSSVNHNFLDSIYNEDEEIRLMIIRIRNFPSNLKDNDSFLEDLLMVYDIVPLKASFYLRNGFLDVEARVLVQELKNIENLKTFLLEDGKNYFTYPNDVLPDSILCEFVET